jgi:Tol biopolymer transport system component
VRRAGASLSVDISTRDRVDRRLLYDSSDSGVATTVDLLCSGQRPARGVVWSRWFCGVVFCFLLVGCSQAERASHCLGEPDLDIWQTTLEGDVSRLIAAPGADGFARWSPDGEHLAFVASRDGNCEIYVAGADGSEEENLTNSPEDEMYPSWSPEGSEIVFASGGHLHVMVLASGERRQLTDSGLVHAYPDWSPDGEVIVFSGGDETAGPGAIHDLFVMPASGGEEIALTAGDRLLVAPRWSPDGESIAYFDHGDPFRIWTMNRDGSDPRVRLNGGHFSWSPDGASLVHDREVGQGDVDLFIDESLLVDGAGIDTLPDWSPDGTTVVFSSDRP